MYLASAKAVIAYHAICPDVSYPTFYPATCNPKDIAAAFNAEESMALGTMETYVNGIVPAYIIKEWKEKNAVPYMEKKLRSC